MILHGVDFTSRPSPRKPITLASGQLNSSGCLSLEKIESFTDFTEFEAFLQRPGPWLGAFDFPFGLPRELISEFQWPTSWPELIRYLAPQTRETLRSQFKSFCDKRPVGHKFAHREADLLVRSSSSMKWVNPPVAWMLLEGTPRLLQAGISIPGLIKGDTERVALEGYPAIVARAVIGNTSYKSDEARKQNTERRHARIAILDSLLQGKHPLGITLAPLATAIYSELINDGTADKLDAVFCLVEAAWAYQRREQQYGFPDDFDPIEGWIVTATRPA